MPMQEGVGRDQCLEITEGSPTEGLSFRGQATAPRIGESDAARAELLLEDAILFLEIVDEVTLLLVDPAGDGHDEKLQHLGKPRHTGRA